MTRRIPRLDRRSSIAVMVPEALFLVQARRKEPIDVRRCDHLSRSHMTEPPDLWIERVDKEFRDRAPRVVSGEQGGKYGLWFVCEGLEPRAVAGTFAAAASLGAGMYAVQERLRQKRGIALAQIPDAKISVCHRVGSMLAASGTIIIWNKSP